MTSMLDIRNRNQKETLLQKEYFLTRLSHYVVNNSDFVRGTKGFNEIKLKTCSSYLFTLCENTNIQLSAYTSNPEAKENLLRPLSSGSESDKLGMIVKSKLASDQRLPFNILIQIFDEVKETSFFIRKGFSMPQTIDMFVGYEKGSRVDNPRIDDIASKCFYDLLYENYRGYEPMKTGVNNDFLKNFEKESVGDHADISCRTESKILVNDFLSASLKSADMRANHKYAGDASETVLDAQIRKLRDEIGQLVVRTQNDWGKVKPKLSQGLVRSTAVTNMKSLDDFKLLTKNLSDTVESVIQIFENYVTQEEE